MTTHVLHLITKWFIRRYNVESSAVHERSFIDTCGCDIVLLTSFRWNGKFRCINQGTTYMGNLNILCTREVAHWFLAFRKNFDFMRITDEPETGTRFCTLPCTITKTSGYAAITSQIDVHFGFIFLTIKREKMIAKFYIYAHSFGTRAESFWSIRDRFGNLSCLRSVPAYVARKIHPVNNSPLLANSRILSRNSEDIARIMGLLNGEISYENYTGTHLHNFFGGYVSPKPVFHEWWVDWKANT